MTTMYSRAATIAGCDILRNTTQWDVAYEPILGVAGIAGHARMACHSLLPALCRRLCLPLSVAVLQASPGQESPSTACHPSLTCDMALEKAFL